ncbi:hypothetical protein BJ166DRAFT_615715, partial [Pestalotiopsis sp. NC0098]
QTTQFSCSEFFFFHSLSPLEYSHTYCNCRSRYLWLIHRPIASARRPRRDNIRGAQPRRRPRLHLPLLISSSGRGYLLRSRGHAYSRVFDLVRYLHIQSSSEDNIELMTYILEHENNHTFIRNEKGVLEDRRWAAKTGLQVCTDELQIAGAIDSALYTTAELFGRPIQDDMDMSLLYMRWTDGGIPQWLAINSRATRQLVSRSIRGLAPQLKADRGMKRSSSGKHEDSSGRIEDDFALANSSPVVDLPGPQRIRDQDYLDPVLHLTPRLAMGISFERTKTV